MELLRILRGLQLEERLKRMGPAGLAVIVVLGSWLMLETALNAPTVRAELEHRNAVAIEEEDGSFCGTFGMPPGTEAFARCTRELARIRQREAARLRRATSFF